MRSCFECGTAGEIHAHHVVPRSKGGTRTIDLCGRCHGLVHGAKTLRMGTLTSAAMKAKQERGEYTGGRIPYGSQLSADGVHLVPHAKEQREIRQARSLRASGMTLRAVSDRLWELGIASRTGKRLQPVQVQRMIAARDVQELQAPLI